MVENGSAHSMYSKLKEKRQHYLNRGREAAIVTVPALLPPEGWNATLTLPTPWQGLGERGVRNLASKLLLILFPPGVPSFELALKPETDADQTTAGAEGEAFANIERAIVNELEATTIRVRAFEMVKQLIVVGNVLIRIDNNTGSFKVFKLTDYVVRRSANGIPEVIILKQMVSPRSLPEEFRGFLPDNHDFAVDVELYTMIRRSDDNTRWDIHQELKEIKLPGTEAADPIDTPSWLPLRMEAIDGEDYGRSYVEGLLGDLNAYDALSQHLLDGAAISAKVTPIVRPGSVLKPRDLEGPNLKPVLGNPEEVSYLKVEKNSDFAAAFQMYSILQDRLEFSFLLNTAIQRNAERVTAEEIRFMAGELDQALGGVYSTLSQEFQRPFIRYQLFRLIQQGRLGPEAPQFVDIKITTGLQTLGRGTELVNLRGAFQDLVAFAGPEMAVKLLKVTEAAKRVFSAHQVDPVGLLKTQEELKAELDAERVQSMTQTAIEGAAPGVAKVAAETLAQQ